MAAYQSAINDSLPLHQRKEHINTALAKSQGKDSIHGQLLYSKCSLHYALKEYDSLYITGKILTTHSQNSSNFLSLGKYQHLMAYYHGRVTHDTDSAFYYHNQAKNQFIKIEDSARIGRRLLSMSIIQKNRNDHFGAKETLTEALGYLDESLDKKFIASVYNELATNHGKLLNHTDAINYYTLAIKTTASPNDRQIYQNNLATIYMEQKEYETARSILLKLLDSIPAKRSVHYARVLDNLSYTNWALGNPEATNGLHRALQIRKEVDDLRGQMASYTHLAEAYLNKRPVQARGYLDTLIQISRRLAVPRAEIDALKYLMRLETRNDDHKLRYISLQDSMHSVDLQVKTQFAKMKYDDRIKQEAILKLQATEATKNAELAEQQTQKVIYLSLGSILLALSGLYIYFMLQRHKKEKMQEIYTTEKRISKKVHDELANDIYGVMTNLQHNSGSESPEVLDTLEHIYQKTRDISYETGDVDTRNFHLSLKKLLAQYQSPTTNIAVMGLEESVWKNTADYKKIAVYRAIHELMVNMKKHSEASLVSLSFQRRHNQIHIQYVDNGIGMKPEQKKGNGLRNTENRIRNIDGTLILAPEFNKGLKVSILFPK
ncbi:tetratricopeptide repeat-containing sensor histidine kinase [Poritiphilus flavus]|uniref:histidine kinase n=1 Tax=Poritiphilus flavus TaxID=2697053 RepID=A0A6L9EHT0_9FLAO|nr:tetratricopeptide repeat-containing sensor histidine kinase [Poritiphilus flavus]NAS14330.1 hypothetical protein [Poritiphilus flavus]